jgi:drug/metabolite transporter (DMT)-like permease
VFLGWLIAGETVGPRMLLASTVIIAGVAIITFQRGRGKAPVAVNSTTEAPRAREEAA